MCRRATFIGLKRRSFGEDQGLRMKGGHHAVKRERDTQPGDTREVPEGAELRGKEDVSEGGRGQR